MRPVLVAVSSAAVLAVAMGCAGAPSTPRSTDTAGAGRIGAVGNCYTASSARAVDCSTDHMAQTVYVSDQPSDDRSTALVPCRQAQSDFLGQDFHTRLDVRLWVASDGSWSRCDLVLRTSTAGNAYETITSTLENAFESGVPVGLRACLADAYDPGHAQRYVPCTEQHAAEELTVAPVLAPFDEPFPADVAERAAEACNASADAAGMLDRHQTVVAFYPEDASAWSTGERTADCWAIANEGTLPPVQEKG
ncbi:MAG: septum formation family protein [Nocardioidaceae bacterium]